MSTPLRLASPVVMLAIDCDEPKTPGFKGSFGSDLPFRGEGGKVRDRQADFQPPDKRMTTPAAAPMNSKKHAVDWMKNPGNRFSTALL